MVSMTSKVMPHSRRRNWVHFLNSILFLAGPEGLGRKTSNFGLNTLQDKEMISGHLDTPLKNMVV